MSNKAEFVVKLIDKLTAPARTMSKALGDIEKTEQAVTKASSDVERSLNRVGMQASAMGAGAMRGARGLNKVALAMIAARRAAVVTDAKGRNRFGGKFVTANGLQKRAVKIKGAVDANGVVQPVKRSWLRGLLDWNKAAGDSLEKWGDLRADFMKTPLGMVGRGLGGVATFAASAAVEVGLLAAKVTLLSAAVGGLAAGALTKATVEMGMFAERSRAALGAINKSQSFGEFAFKSAVNAARDYNASVTQTVEQMISLQRAGFGVQEALDIIGMGADMRALGSTADAVDRAVLAITQIRNTGKLQGDELMQLADAGISIDLVYKNLGKSLGKTTAQVVKLKEAGKITAAQAIAAIKQSVLDTSGSKQFGDFGKKVAQTTLTGMVDGLKAMPEQLLLDLSERMNMGAVRDIVGRIRDAFGRIDASKLVSAIDVTVKLLGKALDFAIAFGEGFGSEFDSMIGAANDLNDKLTPERVRDWGEMLGSALGKAITNGEKLLGVIVDIVDNVRTLADDLTKVMTLLGMVQRRPGPPPLPTELGKTPAPSKGVSDVMMGAGAKLSPLNNWWAGPLQPAVNAAEAVWTGLTGLAEVKAQQRAVQPASGAVKQPAKVITLAPVINTTVQGGATNAETGKAVNEAVSAALDDAVMGRMAEAF